MHAETASAFSYMAELLTEFLPEHEPNERLYRLVVATLEAIEDQVVFFGGAIDDAFEKGFRLLGRIIQSLNRLGIDLWRAEQW